MGRSDISFGSSEYLPSPVQTSPLPPWKISAWLVEGIPFTRGRHLPHQVPLPLTKIPHPRTRFVAKSSRKWPEVARKKEFNAIYSVHAEIFGDEAHLGSGIEVAVAVPVGFLQCLHQLGAAIDLIAQLLQRRLLLFRKRTDDPRQFFFPIVPIFYHRFHFCYYVLLFLCLYSVTLSIFKMDTGQ